MNEIYLKFGDLLKLERERRSLTLAAVSESLKISESNLEHIEAGAVDLTPSELYFTLFAKSYSEFLGIDYTRTIEAIKEDLGEELEPDPEVDDEPKGEDEKSAEATTEEGSAMPGLSKALVGWFAAIVLAFAAFLVIWLLVLDSPADESAPGQEDLNQSGITDEPAEKTKSPDSLWGDYEWGKVPDQPPPPLDLKLKAREESWAMVVADGDTVIYRNLVLWKEYQVEAKHRLIVTIAHPTVVETSLNGQTVDLRDSVTGRISGREITQINVEQFFDVQPTDANPSGPGSTTPPPIPNTDQLNTPPGVTEDSTR